MGIRQFRPVTPATRFRIISDFEEITKPYGVYDVAANAGFVSLGITSDTLSSPSRRSAAGSDGWGANAIQKRKS